MKQFISSKVENIAGKKNQTTAIEFHNDLILPITQCGLPGNYEIEDKICVIKIHSVSILP